VRLPVRMPTVTELSRRWKVTHQYVSKLRKRGMPIESVESAEEWRECYASKRPPRARQTDGEEDNSAEDSALIPLVTARDMAWHGYTEILNLVLELPESAAAQCNPLDPKLAFDVLESQTTGILCAACEVYAAWSKGGPHISTATDAQ
jgi:hypothetical protein